MTASYYGMIEEVGVMLIDSDTTSATKMIDFLKSYDYKVAAPPSPEFISDGVVLKYDFTEIEASILDDFYWGVLALRWRTCWDWSATPKVIGAPAAAAGSGGDDANLVDLS
ncbi:hypothetical protein BC332_23253 [Capsicum chinense]|nr:hypothetical protein BC332_23253 [Capsicum chinense]